MRLRSCALPPPDGCLDRRVIRAAVAAYLDPIWRKRIRSRSGGPPAGARIPLPEPSGKIATEALARWRRQLMPAMEAAAVAIVLVVRDGDVAARGPRQPISAV